MKIGIIGYGEIGSSLHKVYQEQAPHMRVEILDQFKGEYGDIQNCKFLNICIPYVNEGFVEIVNGYIDQYIPILTVIHSTVAPGTTAKIKGSVIHSPVRGLHPNLDLGMKTFIKWVGSEQPETSQEYADHLFELGIQSHICSGSKESEYAKLLDTTYYGVCIAFHSEVNKLCQKEGLNFDDVMTKYNTTYNQGYAALGKSNVVRPVLYPSTSIGGHCVVPNAKILSQYMDSEITDLILKFEK